MRNDRTEPSSKVELRRRAEKRIKANKAPTGPPDSEADTQRLLQELQVHEIELAMQNEELKRVRDEAEMARREAEAERERYLCLYDFAPVGYLTLDGGGVIRQVNLTGASLLGVERSRLTGQQFRFHIPEESYPAFHAFFRKTFEGETTETFEVMLLSREHPSHFVQLRARLSEDKKECRLVMIDITDHKRAEAALDQARQLENVNKELESFNFSVSHDLRAPLRAIDGYTRMFLKKYGSTFNEDAARMFSVLQSNTKAMGAMIDGLLSFSRVQQNDLSVSKIDMNELAREIWDDVRAAHQERELEVKKTKLLPGFGDRALIREVLFNLLSNAVKFTRDRKPGIIELSSTIESDKVVYCVKDNGVGFDMAYYDKLFGLYRRFHDDEGYEGAGIGLAVVRRIMKRHGGRVWAEGKVDKGATFCFTLPSRKE